MKLSKQHIFLIMVFLVILPSCKSKQQLSQPGGKEGCKVRSDDFYQYSIFQAFVNRIYDGALTAGELKLNGDIGLGCFNGLDGELVMDKGAIYRVSGDGIVHRTGDEDKICFANVTWFDAEDTFEISRSLDYKKMRVYLDGKLPSANLFYAFRIYGKFKRITCGSIQKQEKPYTRGLDEIIPERPVFEKEDVEGTMVGFFCPKFVGHINVAGFHLHFLSEDKNFGGHVIDFESEQLNGEIDYIEGYRFDLPDTDVYREGVFEKVFDYGKK